MTGGLSKKNKIRLEELEKQLKEVKKLNITKQYVKHETAYTRAEQELYLKEGKISAEINYLKHGTKNK